MVSEQKQNYAELRDPKALRVEPLKANRELGRFTTPESLKAVTTLDTDVQRHNVAVTTLASDLAAILTGDVPLDAPVKFATELGKRRLSLASDAVALTTRRIELRKKLHEEFDVYHAARKVEYAAATATAEMKAAEISTDPYAGQLRRGIVAELTKKQWDAYNWTPFQFDGPPRDEHDLAVARRVLGLTLIDAAGCGSLPLPTHALMPV